VHGVGAALVLLLVGLGALAAGVLIGRYYVPDDRQLRRTARHARSYMRAISHLIARDFDTVIEELKTVVEENIEDVEPYFALGAMFRSRGEYERAIRVHQALALRERERRKLRHRALYELGLDFRAAGMPRRATKAMEEVLLDEPGHEGALRALASLYEEQARFNEAAGLWARLGKRRGEDTSRREHHLLVAAGQAALARDDIESAKHLLKSAQKLDESPHFYAAAAELAAARQNFRGTKERLKQALLAEPALVPHLLPGLIAAEENLGTTDAKPPADDLADDTADTSTQRTDLALAEGSGTTTALAAKPAGIPLVPDTKPKGSVTDRVLGVLAEIEAQTGPRLELALIRAQLMSTADKTAQADLATDLATKFPDALAARVAASRRALDGNDDRAIRRSLEELTGDKGVLAWALRGRWQCAHCGHRPGPFSWRCGNCRRWGTLHMETGIEPPPVQPRERRESARGARPEGLLGASPDVGLPSATLDHGLSDEELDKAGTRRSLLGRVGGWFSSRLRRNP
jgi:lipopolysaccharide biosynthesis regulator YciM